MNAFMKNLKKYSELIAMILFFCAAGTALLNYTGGFAAGVMPSIENFFSMILHVALWGVYPMLLILKKKEAAKWAIKGVAVFWSLTFLFKLLEQPADWAWEDVGFVAAIFGLLIVCAIVTAVVFMALAIAKKDAMKKRIVLFILCGALVLLLVFFALMVVLYAAYYEPWHAFLGLATDYFVLPFAMFFAMIAYVYGEEELTFFPERPARVAAHKPEKTRPRAKEQFAEPMLEELPFEFEGAELEEFVPEELPEEVPPQEAEEPQPLQEESLEDDAEFVEFDLEEEPDADTREE